MASPKLLLLSNSTLFGSSYLEGWKAVIDKFLKESKVRKVLFIPFAAVTIDWNEYTKKVQDALTDFEIRPIHKETDVLNAITEAEAIMIGGGNTFNLLFNLHKFNLIEPIKKQVATNGKPYIGWSAGSNVATPDIGTTNDMPIIWPSSDRALGLFPYNINPHYNQHKAKNQGESRDDRLNEAVIIKRRIIVALSEGTGILATGSPLTSNILRVPTAVRIPDAPLQVRVWQPTDEDKNYRVVDVPLPEGEDPVPLDPWITI